MNRIIILSIAVLMFVGVAGIAQAQTTTPTATQAPATTVPEGAPSTGFGG